MTQSRNKLVVCGDSFNFGIGCTNLYTQPYGVLVAKHFDAELIRLARGGCSNYACHLQAWHAAEWMQPKLIIIGTTSFDRIDWVSENHSDMTYAAIRANNINYHEYPPHLHPQPHHDKPMPFYFQGRDDYKPALLSEQISALNDYLSNTLNPFYRRLKTEPPKKLRMMMEYLTSVMHWDIKLNTDIGVILKAYTYSKNRGINCMVIGSDPQFTDLIPPQDLVHHNWFDFSLRYPDTIGSMHASEEGHAVFAKTLIERVKQNGYL